MVTPSSNVTKLPRGQVTFEVFRGKLRIRLPRKWCGGSHKYIYTGLLDTPANRETAQTRCTQIEADYKLGQFDSTLFKYRPQSHLHLIKGAETQPQDTETKTQMTLLALWGKYVDFKRPSVSPSTIGHQYKDIENKLKTLQQKYPSLTLQDATQIRDCSILISKTSDAARRFVMQIKAMSRWAVSSGLIETDYFANLPNIAVPKNRKADDDNDVHPFTKQERDLIIAAFENNQFTSKNSNRVSWHSNYAPYVKFLFYTGCRPSEALGLQWKHIKDGRILFEQGVIDDGKNLVTKRGLKSQHFRYFRINTQLQTILDSIKPDNVTLEDFVFISPSGKFIDVGNFRNRVWVKVLKGLGLDYRKPYQTRHTFITLCLESGVDAKDVAKWVGNSPEIIYKHYATAKKELEVPEL